MFNRAWLDAWAEFNRDYLSRPADRRRLRREAAGFLALAALLLLNLLLWGLIID
jgi:hypothetical protein